MNKSVAAFQTRVTSFLTECQSGDLSTEIRKQHLLAIQSALRAEANCLHARAVELQLPNPAWYAAILIFILTCFQTSVLRFKRRQETFEKLIPEAETSPTYYCDLVLWFVIPSSHSEELMGDLAEEYQLLKESHGEALAKAWYHRQVFTTIVDLTWMKIERLAAIGAIIDFVVRRLKR